MGYGSNSIEYWKRQTGRSTFNDLRRSRLTFVRVFSHLAVDTLLLQAERSRTCHASYPIKVGQVIPFLRCASASFTPPGPKMCTPFAVLRHMTSAAFPDEFSTAFCMTESSVPVSLRVLFRTADHSDNDYFNVRARAPAALVCLPFAAALVRREVIMLSSLRSRSS